MITDKATSLRKLTDFFEKSVNVSTLDIPEMIYLDGGTTSRINLALSDTAVSTVNFKNLTQTPFYIGGSNLKNVVLDNIKYVEFGGGSPTTLNNLVNYYTNFLQNTKLQTLELPAFLGTRNAFADGQDETNLPYVSFRNNYWLRDVGLGQNVFNVGHDHNGDCFNGYWFMNNYNLKFLRLYYPYVLPLNRLPSGLATTPIGDNEINTAFVFVPNELLSAYKENAQWEQLGRSNFKPLDEYDYWKSLDIDKITKSWSEIIQDCANDNLGSYRLGDTKTITIDGVPTQMMIVQIKNSGLNTTQIQYHKTADGNTPSLIWMERTINRFEPIALRTLNSSIPRKYENVTELQNYLTSLYNNIDDANLKSGIKTMRNMSYGSDGTTTDYFAYNEAKLWVPSTMELGNFTYDPNNPMPTYQYYQNPEYKLDYKLGETNNRTGVTIVTRDFAGPNASLLTTLQYNATKGQMDIMNNPTDTPYVIFGFAT